MWQTRLNVFVVLSPMSAVSFSTPSPALQDVHVEISTDRCKRLRMCFRYNAVKDACVENLIREIVSKRCLSKMIARDGYRHSHPFVFKNFLFCLYCAISRRMVYSFCLSPFVMKHWSRGMHKIKTRTNALSFL